MPDLNLSPRSELEHLVVAGRHGAALPQPGVTMQLKTSFALASVMTRSDRVDALARSVRAAFVLDLPLTPRHVVADTVSVMWAGPARWLFAKEGISGQAWEADLRRHFAGVAAVIDQSDSRIWIRVEGAKAREALAKGVPIDLHPRAFRTGDTALTMAATIAVQVWQVDDRPTYEFLVPRTLAADFWRWLVAASSEFGVEIRTAS